LVLEQVFNAMVEVNLAAPVQLADVNNCACPDEPPQLKIIDPMAALRTL